MSEGAPSSTTLNQIYSVSGPESDGAASFNEFIIGNGGNPNYPEFTLDNVNSTCTSATAVPEPSVFGILIAGAGTLLFARRRKIRA